MVTISAFFYYSRLEKRLINEKKQVCISFARQLSDEIEKDQPAKIFIQGLISGGVSRDSLRMIDRYLTELFTPYLADYIGLEGGAYFSEPDDFMGYAFPTSPPPVPAYGPPPRSYKIIRDQADSSVTGNREIINVHAFDPAVFPLATAPLSFQGDPVGAVWIRVHIERELPVARLKRIINVATLLSLFGFLVMAMISLFLRSGIKNIREELKNVHNNPGYRLKRRGGWFGFIPASINDMLAMLERENTDRIELEKQLQHKEKMASLGKMIAGVAHEVRTPLSVVKTRVQMWEREVMQSEEMQQQIPPDSLKLVLDEINRLSQMVKRLVVFSRPIDKNLKLTKLNQVIEEVVSLVDLNGSGKQIVFKRQLETALPVIEADGNTLRQVLINVIKNSVESIGVQGVITIATIYHETKGMVTIEISDTGTGIPDEILNKIFDPFFTSKETGTGLGLSISHEIVAAHNGTITFRNREQGGVKCTITLPVHQNITDYAK
ncbi:MAG: ATP-binding protein [Bacteroidota bacterium]